MIQIVPFAASLPHSGENGEPAMLHRDIINELLNDNGLADAGAAERAYFTAAREWTDEVDDFDAGFEDRRLGILIDQVGSFAVNRISFRELHFTAVIDRIAG